VDDHDTPIAEGHPEKNPAMLGVRVIGVTNRE
jgi:hypothetical protein